MLGAIIGDIVGSRFEWDNIKTKDFELFNENCSPTDDSIMSLSIAKAILDCQENYKNLSEYAVKEMRFIGRKYPYCGYGGHFYGWMFCDNPEPYNSFGNGAAMRVSACGFAARNPEEAIAMSRSVTEVTHNHKEGIKGAEATTVAIFLAKNGYSKQKIKDVIKERYYNINFTLDEIRPTYRFDVTCQGSVPQALECFFESKNFEDAIRNAISIGGDSDTIAAITGGIAEAYYGIPEEIRERAEQFLNSQLIDILKDFEQKYPTKTEIL